jgi:flagellar basal-body rod modification protein FlgD
MPITQTNSATSATNAAAAAAATSSSAADTQDRFLKLLVTQMKNQDPLNPMDNAQVTSQMAQLSTVSGIDKLNVTLQALSDSMSANQSLQATSMIGHGVLVEGKGVDLIKGVGYAGFELTDSADRVNITIKNGAGALVRNIQLEAQPAGIGHWQWDGLDNNGAAVADGSYTFAVNADQAGKKTDVSGLQFGMVNSVTQGKQGVTLSVGQLDGIAMSQVKQIL